MLMAFLRPRAFVSHGRRLHSDMAAAAVIIAVCVVVYAITFTFDTVPFALAAGMGAETFPRLVLWLIIGLALLLAWQARFRIDADRARVPPMVVYTGLTMPAFMAVNEVIGMLPASFLFLVGLGRLWGERRLLALVTSAALFCAAIWAVFVRGFGIRLPTGLLGSLWS